MLLMPIDVVLVAAGTQGDVAPVAALGRALKARGHAVTLVADAMHARHAHELDFHPAAPPEHALAAAADPRLWHYARGYRVVLGGFVLPAIAPTYAYVAERWAKRQRALVVAGTTWALGPRIAHENLGVPYATLHLCPVNLRSNRAPPLFRGLRMTGAWPSFVKDLVWWLLDRAYLDGPVLPTLNAFRERLGLPTVRRVMHRWLHSPQAVLGLFPETFAPPQPDWPEHTQLTGFVFPTEHAPLSPELAAFLDAGPPPVVFSLGSALTPARTLAPLAAEVCRQLGVRGVLLGHEAPSADLPDSVRYFGYVPLGELLPRAAALVHHGGIGTTALALRAGTPQLAMPMAFDQFDNADRMTRLGAGATLDWLHVTAPRLTRALSRMLGGSRPPPFATPDATAQSCELIERLAR